MKNPHSSQVAAPRNSAFTLIELLVVVAIIGVLARLTLSVTKGVMDAARKTSARNDLGAIVTAVKAYYTDYGRYPLAASVTTDAAPGAVFGGPSGTNNEALINILRFATGDPTVTDANVIDPNSLNPRQTHYLEVALVKDPNNPKSGIGKTGRWFDPWGVPYVVFLDGDYNSDIDVSSCFNTSPTFPTKVSIAVGAACIGYDLVVKQNKQPTDAFAAKAFDQSADLLSWR